MAGDDLVRRPPRRPGTRATTGPPAIAANETANPSATPSRATPQAGAAHEQRVAKNREAARLSAARLRARLDVVRARLADVGSEAVAEQEQQVMRARNASSTAIEQGVITAVRDHERRTMQLRDQLDAALGRLSPGIAGSESTEPRRRPTHFPVGTLSTASITVPIVAPLLDHPGWYIAGDRPRACALALDTVTRALAAAPLKHLAIHVFDPALTGQFGALATLRSSVGTSFPVPVSDGAAFARRLGDILSSAGENAELVGNAGRTGLIDLWNSTALPEGTVHLVVLLNYPYGVTEEMQRHLVRLAGARGTSGVSLLVVEDPQVTPERGVVTDELARDLLRIDATANGWELLNLPRHLPFTDAISSVERDAAVTAAIRAVADIQGPTIPLTKLLADDLETPWTHSSIDSLRMLLGEERHQPLGVEFRTANPPQPNMLVGGAVGQGKSNLLLDIIYSLAVRYSPDELDMLLLDFKQGLEFRRFGPQDDGKGWLPHVSVLSLESNLPFGLAVLTHVSEELNRRSALFKRAGVSAYDDYRRLGESLPRVLLIVDEFHALFDGGDDEVEASVTALTQLAKQGRAYGIHMLLASQTISGIRGLAARGDAIFAQFPLRISLKNTAQESEAILSPGNKAASTLTYRGEIILNANFGGDPTSSNTRAIAAYAEPEAMEGVQRSLWTRQHGEPPMMFIATQFAAWRPDGLPERAEAGADEAGLRLLLGQPVAVTQTPATITVEPDTDQAVAVVGKDDVLAGAALAAMARSAIPQLAGGGDIVVLDGTNSSEGWLDRVKHAAVDHSVPLRTIPRDQIAAFLRDEMTARLTKPAQGPTLVLGVALQRARDMDLAPMSESAAGDDFSFDYSSEPPTTGRTVLARIAREGALNGVYLVGSWSNLRAVESDLTLTCAGIRLFVTAGLGLEDVRSLAGATVQPVDGYPRVGLYDRSESGFRTVVPYDLNPADGTHPR